MTLLSERYKNGITVRKLQNDITVSEIKKITLLSERYKYDITVREIQI